MKWPMFVVHTTQIVLLNSTLNTTENSLYSKYGLSLEILLLLLMMITDEMT